MGVTITNSRSGKKNLTPFSFILFIWSSCYHSSEMNIFAWRNGLEKCFKIYHIIAGIYKYYFVKHKPAGFICLQNMPCTILTINKAIQSFIIILNFQFFCKDHSKRLVVPKRKILRSQSNSINKSWRSKLTKSRHHYTGRTLVVLTGTNGVWSGKKFISHKFMKLENRIYKN